MANFADFVEMFIPTLGPIISGTNYDRDMPIYFCRKMRSMRSMCGIQ